MSLKPISEIEGLNNKSLNLYANSIKANSIDSGVIDLTTITCDNLSCLADGIFINDFTAAGANTTLRGNKIPLSTTSAGNLLTNSDGAGTLSWVAPPPLILSGTWTPTVSTVDAGASIVGVSTFNYTLIGDILTFSGDFAATSTNTGALNLFDISLPLGKKPLNPNVVYITGGCGDNTLTVSSSNQLCVKSGTGLTGNNVGVYFSLTKGIDYTVSLLNCVYIVSGQCRVGNI